MWLTEVGTIIHKTWVRYRGFLHRGLRLYYSHIPMNEFGSPWTVCRTQTWSLSAFSGWVLQLQVTFELCYCRLCMWELFVLRQYRGTPNLNQGGGASEQLGGGQDKHAKDAPLGGLRACSSRKFFKFASSEIESGVIWRHMKPSTHISEVK